MANQEKLPPQNVEAEKSLLGSLMIDPNAIYKVADFLLTKDFYKASHQKIYASMLELFEKREPIDVLSVSAKLKGRNELDEIGAVSYLTELVNAVPTATHVLNYAKIVQQKRVLRELISTGFEISEMAQQEDEDVDSLLDRAEKKIFGIAQKTLSQNFSHIKDSLEETWQRIDELSKNQGGLRGIPTGFKSLDNILAGFQKSDLIILAARPSVGKSSLAINIAQNVACLHKIPVGIFSLEMSKDQIIDRLISAQANIDSWRLRTGRLSDEGEYNDFERIQSAMAVLAEAPIYIDDSSGNTILQMRAMARRLFADKGLGLLIIDYLQLMEHRNPMMGLVQQVSENSRALKGMARELNIPVLVVSQLSRAVEQRTPAIPRLSDLRDSGCLAGDTLITRADTGERIKIVDLVGQTNIPVHSLDENFQIKEKMISKVFCSGEKMVYELKTRSGLAIKASANHPFFKFDGWHKLDQLKTGDRISVPRQLPEIKNPVKVEDEKIIVLAHMIGDGSYTIHETPTYTSPSKQNILIVKKCVERAFNIKCTLCLRTPSESQSRIRMAGKNKTRKSEKNELNNWLRELGIFGQTCSNKEIPNLIFQLPNRQIAIFIKHLWATDGSIFFAKNSKNYALSFSSTSGKLISQLQSLLLRLGIISNQGSLRKHKVKHWKTEHQLLIHDKEHQFHFLEEIGIFGREKEVRKMTDYLKNRNTKPKIDVIPKEAWRAIDEARKKQGMQWRDLAKAMGVSMGGFAAFGKRKTNIGREKMKKILNVLPDPLIKKIINADILWDEIFSIKKLGVEKVYDATILETHNFIANDIIVHNSIEQDADVVMFIYKEDRYKENSERPGIADIIIAKHRNGPVGKVELYFDEARMVFRDIDKKYGE